MRLFKTTKQTVPPVVPPFVPADSLDNIIDVEAAIAAFDARDDAAPIASVAAPKQPIETIDFVDVVPTSDEPARTRGRFSKMFAAGKSAPAEQAMSPVAETEQSASPVDAPEARPTRKKLFFGSKPKAATVDTPDAAPDIAASAEAEYVPAPDAPLTANQKFKARFARKGKAADKANDQVIVQVPVKVIVGYLPDVTARDAAEYAQGVAAKHIDNLGMAFYDAFKLDRGFAYEVHEGGSGKAYLPDIIKYFGSLGAFNAEDQNKVYIRTATRTVEVSRQRDGVSAVLLPEAQKPMQPAWLRGTVAMRPAINKRTGILVAGAVVFVTGFIAMLFTATFARLQPYEPAGETVVERIEYNRLPISQFDLQIAPAIGNQFIKALRYKDGQWKLETEALEPPASAAPIDAAQAPAMGVASQQAIQAKP